MAENSTINHLLSLLIVSDAIGSYWSILRVLKNLSSDPITVGQYTGTASHKNALEWILSTYFYID